MTFVVECVRAGPLGGERFDVAESVWWQLLGLALGHGWLPEGAAPWLSALLRTATAAGSFLHAAKLTSGR
jgi:hypothetical protein